MPPDHLASAIVGVSLHMLALPSQVATQAGHSDYGSPSTNGLALWFCALIAEPATAKRTLDGLERSRHEVSATRS